MDRADSAWTGLLDTVVSSLTEGVTVLDATGRFLIANAAALRSMGFTDGTLPESREKIVALTPDGAEIAVADRPTSRALAGETVLDELIVHRGPTGDRMILVSALPLDPDPETGHSRCLCIFRDVSEEHAARAELTAFASVVAHDLRGPLTAMQMWTELADDDLRESGTLRPDLAGDLVGRLQSEIRRMTVLIEDLHAHAVSRDRTLVITDVDLNALVEDVVAARAASEHVALDALPTVRGDQVLLRQALDNLIANALKFVAPGADPDVRVSAVVADAVLRLRVADHGIEVPEGAHGDIFGEFRRLHPAYPGTGLGLAIVKRVAERHDGTVSARANPDGPGTLVEMLLPAEAVVR